jgi:hypothetical protein
MLGCNPIQATAPMPIIATAAIPMISSFLKRTAPRGRPRRTRLSGSSLRGASA